MKQTFPKLALTLIGAAALVLTGCGGGGGADASTPPAAVTLSGIAASGAAFSGATVQVIDSTGKVVGTSDPVGTDGTYQVKIQQGAVAPFVLVATRTSTTGDVQSLVSVLASTAVTQVNVTPITHLIASRLSASGDPTKLASELKAGSATITANDVAEAVAEIKNILGTLLTATGTADADPLKDSFVVNGTGYDKLLDSISINIVPASANSTNIEIAVKQQLSESAQPAVINFTSSAAVAPVLPAISASTLVADGTSTKIAAFLDDLTRCYAVPFASRVNGVTTGATAVTGTAIDVIATACKAVFWESNPATFKSNGALVGRNANNGGAFASLFRSGATGVVFSRGTYEFTRGNGDMVIGYMSRSTDGSETFDTLVVRKDPVDEKLKLIGNQYQFPGGVSAYQQHRQQLKSDQLDYSYRSTGYTVGVDNRVDGSGNSIFDHVEVTTPRGSTLTLKPVAGYSYLNLVKGSGATVGTNFVRLRSAFDKASTTATFATLEPGLFFSGLGYTDADIAAFASQSNWTFKYFFTPTYLAANPSITDGLTQTYRTRARAMTIEELKTRSMAQLSASDVSEIQNQLVPKGIDFEGTPDNVVHWTVPTGALPPTSLKFWGNLYDTTTGARLQGFEDSISFGSTLRQSPLTPCSSTGAGDNHCSSTPVTGSYAAGAFVNSLHLWARDNAGREFASFYAWYPLVLPSPP